MTIIKLLSTFAMKEDVLANELPKWYASKDRSGMFLFLLLVHDTAMRFKECKNSEDRHPVASEVPVRRAKKDKLIGALIALQIIARVKTRYRSEIQIIDNDFKTWFNALDPNSDVYQTIVGRTKKLFASQQKKSLGRTKSGHYNLDHERRLLCEWIISSNLTEHVSTCAELSIHRLASLLGVQSQTIRKQIQHKNFPYHYIPGGMSKPLGKFSSIFISKQLPEGNGQLWLESKLLEQFKDGECIHLAKFERCSAILQSSVLRYFRGDYPTAFVPQDFIERMRKQNLAVREYVNLGALGLSQSEWHTSFPNILVRLLKTIPHCWAARAALNASETSATSGVKDTSEIAQYSSGTEQEKEGLSERASEPELLDALHLVLQNHFELGVERKKPISYQAYCSLAFIANTLLNDIHNTAVALELWKNESEVTISYISPYPDANMTEFRVFYVKKHQTQ